MADQYRMDGHKLHWHLDRVNDWLNGKRIAPLHIDAGLSKGCNIRCEYCYGVTQGNFFKEGAKIYFPREPLLNYVKDAGEAGVRSMAIIGEAEPTLNPNLYDAIIAGHKAGMDMSLGTNGILLDTTEKGEEALANLKWVRFNISAADQQSYERIHGSKLFETALAKIRFCVETKKKNHLDLTVGLQSVLIPSNVNQMVPLAKLGRELGVDYFVIKHCSDTRENTLGVFDSLNEYHGFEQLLKDAEAQSSEGYNVIVKWNKIMNEGKRRYDSCLCSPFLINSSGDGKVFPCGMFFFDRQDEFCMGDLTKQSFKDIIKSEQYWRVVERLKHFDVHTECYSNCRGHYVCEYLWDLTHPPDHVNFI